MIGVIISFFIGGMFGFLIASVGDGRGGRSDGENKGRKDS